MNDLAKAECVGCISSSGLNDNISRQRHHGGSSQYGIRNGQPRIIEVIGLLQLNQCSLRSGGTIPTFFIRLVNFNRTSLNKHGCANQEVLGWIEGNGIRQKGLTQIADITDSLWSRSKERQRELTSRQRLPCNDTSGQRELLVIETHGITHSLRNRLLACSLCQKFTTGVLCLFKLHDLGVIRVSIRECDRIGQGKEWNCGGR